MNLKTPHRGSSAIAIMRHRGFRALFAAQLLGAFNDNLFKMLTSLLAVDAGGIGHSGGYLSLVGAIFMLPYLLFSGYAGYFADRFDKRSVLVLTKAAEIAIMAAALIALSSGQIALLLAALFLLATQATFFSPAKYGILPEIFAVEALPQANGLLEMSRYISIILGTACGGVVLALWGNRPVLLGILLIGVATLGFIASFGISRVPRSGAVRKFRANPWREIATGVRRLREEPGLMLTVGGLTYFDCLGSLLLLDIILLGKETMGIGDAATSLLGAFIGCGIGLGSVTAGRLSRGRIEIGIACVGAVGVGLGVLLLASTADSYAWIAGVLVAIGFFGGFIVVPLNATLQKKAGQSERGHIISTSNFLNMTAVLLSSGLLWILHDLLRLRPSVILLLGGVTTLALILFGLRRFPNYRRAAAKWVRCSFGSAGPEILLQPKIEL